MGRCLLLRGVATRGRGTKNVIDVAEWSTGKCTHCKALSTLPNVTEKTLESVTEETLD